MAIYGFWTIWCLVNEKQNAIIRIASTINTYAFLIRQLVARDFKKKYKNSALGVLWSFLNPLLTMLVQYLVFSTIFKSTIENFIVYLLSGIILFNFFGEAVGQMCIRDRYDAVVIGDMPSHERNLLLKYCYISGIRSYSVPKISDVLLRSSDELNLFDTPLLLSRNMGLSVEQEWMKRAEDIIVSLLMVILFSPIFVLAAVGIKCTDGGPIFYKQERLTKDGKIFMIYKFRTMIVDAEKKSGPVLASEHDPRILPIGRILRATRLDELPQILNILKGEMSVVRCV